MEQTFPCGFCGQLAAGPQGRASHERHVHGRVYKHKSVAKPRNLTPDPKPPRKQRVLLVLPHGLPDDELEALALRRARGRGGRDPEIAALEPWHIGGDSFYNWSVVIAHVDVMVRS